MNQKKLKFDAEILVTSVASGYCRYSIHENEVERVERTDLDNEARNVMEVIDISVSLLSEEGENIKNVGKFTVYYGTYEEIKGLFTDLGYEPSIIEEFPEEVVDQDIVDVYNYYKAFGDSDKHLYYECISGTEAEKIGVSNFFFEEILKDFMCFGR